MQRDVIALSSGRDGTRSSSIDRDDIRLSSEHRVSNTWDWNAALGCWVEQVRRRVKLQKLKSCYLWFPSSNEAWRYSGGFAKPITFMGVLSKGFKWGFAAFVVSLAVEYAFFPPKKDEGHHWRLKNLSFFPPLVNYERRVLTQQDAH